MPAGGLLGAGGKPSTRFPPGKLVELSNSEKFEQFDRFEKLIFLILCNSCTLGTSKSLCLLRVLQLLHTDELKKLIFTYFLVTLHGKHQEKHSNYCRFCNPRGPRPQNSRPGLQDKVNKLWRREVHLAFFLKVKAESVTEYGSGDHKPKGRGAMVY